MAEKKKESEKKGFNISLVVIPALLVIIVLLVVLLFRVYDNNNDDNYHYTDGSNSGYNSNNNNNDNENNDNSGSDSGSDSNSFNNSGSNTNAKITRDKALEIALKDLGIKKSATFDIDIELENKYDTLVYEVSFNSGAHEYEYYIDANSGKILHSFREIDY